MDNKVALITGCAKRIGAVIAQKLHAQGYNIVVHYHRSKKEAEALCQKLNEHRPDSAITCQGNINEVLTCQTIVKTAIKAWNRLDALVNNASSFYETPLEAVDEKAWNDLLGSNLKGPLFLSQACMTHLKQTKGAIVNIADIHSDRPLKHYVVYCIAKAGLVMLTKSLARELAPEVRVNAVAPGPILWSNEELALPQMVQTHILNRTCLKRIGSPKDIAETVSFLLKQSYITGQVIAVDGGRSIKD